MVCVCVCVPALDAAFANGDKRLNMNEAVMKVY